MFAIRTSIAELPYPAPSTTTAAGAGEGTTAPVESGPADRMSPEPAGAEAPPAYDDYGYDAPTYDDEYQAPEPHAAGGLGDASTDVASRLPAGSTVDVGSMVEEEGAGGVAPEDDPSSTRMPTDKWHPSTVNALRTLDVALRSKVCVVEGGGEGVAGHTGAWGVQEETCVCVVPVVEFVCLIAGSVLYS
jgi:hypothetical protein